MKHWLAGFAMACCVAATAVAGEDAAGIKITNLTKGAKQGVLALDSKARVGNNAFSVSALSDNLKGLPLVTVPRGEMSKPGAAFTVTIDKPATAYLLVMNRGKATIPEGWTKTDEKVSWKMANSATFTDTVYSKKVEAGEVEVPEHDGKDGGSYGVPNAIAFKAE